MQRRRRKPGASEISTAMTTGNACSGQTASTSGRRKLREESADKRGFRDAADGQDHGTGARRDVMLAHRVHHLVKGTNHDLLQAGVHFLDVPHEAFLVLHPFEVTYRDPAGVGENIRSEERRVGKE